MFLSGAVGELLSAAIHNLGFKFEFQIHNILSQVCEPVIIQMTWIRLMRIINPGISFWMRYFGRKHNVLFQSQKIIWLPLWNTSEHMLKIAVSFYSLYIHFLCPCRVVWSLFCCPSCVWCWSCTLVDAGVNVAGYLSRRRALVLKQPMRFTTSPRCWWVDRPGKVWEILAGRATTRAAPSASVRLRSWTGTSMTSQTYDTTFSGSAWMAERTSPVRWHVHLTHFKGAMTKLAWTSLQVCEPSTHCTVGI